MPERSPSRWRPSLPATLLAFGLAALAAGLSAGLTVGPAYGRYTAVQNLLERRPPVLDGALDGLRPLPGAPPVEIAYLGGHYYLTEPPLLTWLALPLHALGALLALLQPGAGWTPALTALLGPLLYLSLLLGVAVLGRAYRLPLAWQLVALVSTVAFWPMLPAAALQSAWLAPAALAVWLIVGLGWRGRGPTLLHGCLAGLLIGTEPWLALPALVALLAPLARIGYPQWRDVANRGLGLALALAPVAAWQWLFFGRPWRFASQFRVGSAEPVDPTSRGLTLLVLLVLAGVIVVLAQRRWPALIVMLLPLGLEVAGAPDQAVGLMLGLAGTVLFASNPPLAAGRWRIAGIFDSLWLAVFVAWFFWNGPTLYRLAWANLTAVEPIVELDLLPRLVTVVLIMLPGLALRWLSPTRLGLLVAGLAAVVVSAASIAARSTATPLAPSLVAPFEVAAGDGTPVRAWRLVDGATVTEGRLQLPTSAARAESPIIAARPGERYCATAVATGATVIFVWEDDGHRPLDQQGGPTSGGGRCFAAPLATTGLRLWLTGGPAPAQVERVHLQVDRPRVAPLPDYAMAALAFTFDWESTMGGLIHSKGGSAADEGERGGAARDDDSRSLAIAVERGARMRTGAQVLADLFQPYGIRGTFYSTGYNLLSGNTERRQFAGNPTYRWASVQNRWASNYWVTHPWYSDDPYGTEATHPQWYYASLTRALAAAGHEIEPHTFGHLYVRGTSPDELAVDLDEWNQAAQALGLPRARSFAFPWQSSNSVREPHYTRLAQAGITSVTRVYPQTFRQRPWLQYELDEVEGMPGMVIYPDIELKASPASGQQARLAIDTVLVRQGYVSLWTHPEEVVDPPQVAVWRDVIAYAASARDRGLWVAPLVEIVHQVRAARRVEVVAVRDGRTTTLRVTNAGVMPLQGTIIDHGLSGAVTHAGQPWTETRPGRLRLPTLGIGQTTTLQVLDGGGGR